MDEATLIQQVENGGFVTTGDLAEAVPSTTDDVTYNPTSLYLDEMGYYRWTEIGNVLRRIGKAHQWWLGDWLLYGERKFPTQYSQVLAHTDYEDEGSLRDIAWVARQFADVSLRNDRLTFSHHREVARLMPIDKDVALQMLVDAEHNGWSVRQLREYVRVYISELERAERKQSLLTGVMKDVGDYDVEMALVTYHVLLAFPEWEMDYTGSDDMQSVVHPNQMKAADLCALPISDIASQDAVLFLVVPPTRIPDALTVIKAWGFDYRTSICVEYPRTTRGRYVMNNHKVVMIARRGIKLDDIPDTGKPYSLQLLDYSQAEYYYCTGNDSPAIENIFTLVNAMYPDMDKLSLFRVDYQRKGWTSWQPTI